MKIDVLFVIKKQTWLPRLYFILKPPVTARLTESVILRKELIPHASVCLSITHCQSVFKDLMKFVHERNYFNCFFSIFKIGHICFH